MGARRNEPSGLRMGHGDQLIATGFARGAAARGKRVAFGDGQKICWDKHSPEIFAGNPNIAPPGAETAPDLEWNEYRKGNRLYNAHDEGKKRWLWNMAFRCPPGEMFFDRVERERGRRAGSGFVLIEPHVERWKNSAANKDWGRTRYQQVATRLLRANYRVCQFVYVKGEPPLAGVEMIRTRSFRDALAVMEHAALFVGPEGGLHHGAAAVGIPAVVLFGGFIPPQVTGYEGHTNLTGGAEACGSLFPCRHCHAAMAAITVEEVEAAALQHLKRAA
jgi:hypothetical protein